MKHAWLRILAVSIALLLAVPTAYAMDTEEVSLGKLQAFYDALIEQNIIPNDGALLDKQSIQTYEGETTAYYSLTDYLMLSTVFDPALSRIYRLYILQADLPDTLHANEIYALFVEKCVPTSAEEALTTVDWLLANTARTDLYALTAGKNLQDCTVLYSGSISDSEDSISIVQYTDEY